mmetsp:Transcript_23147/g.62758  ORF Transcript_23147/g.62758 Transcript_23147/m.62758 type:complete len:230 (-) Transcript_23147:1303-1992(-)
MISRHFIGNFLATQADCSPCFAGQAISLEVRFTPSNPQPDLRTRLRACTTHRPPPLPQPLLQPSQLLWASSSSRGPSSCVVYAPSQALITTSSLARWKRSQVTSQALPSSAISCCGTSTSGTDPCSRLFFPSAAEQCCATPNWTTWPRPLRTPKCIQADQTHPRHPSHAACLRCPQGRLGAHIVQQLYLRSLQKLSSTTIPPSSHSRTRCVTCSRRARAPLRTWTCTSH